MISWSKCRPLKSSCAEVGSVIAARYRQIRAYSRQFAPEPEAFQLSGRLFCGVLRNFLVGVSQRTLSPWYGEIDGNKEADLIIARPLATHEDIHGR